MKVEFLKDHMNYEQGKQVDVSQEQGVYFIRCGVAKEVIKQTKELKQKLETK